MTEGVDTGLYNAGKAEGLGTFTEAQDERGGGKRRGVFVLAREYGNG